MPVLVSGVTIRTMLHYVIFESFIAVGILPIRVREFSVGQVSSGGGHPSVVDTFGERVFLGLVWHCGLETNSVGFVKRLQHLSLIL